MPKWLKALEQFAPMVLAFTPLAPIAGAVAAGIAAAEAIPGATGPQKKQIVQQLVTIAAQAANAQAGKPVVDPVAFDAVSGQVIDSVVGVVNLAHRLPETPVVVVGA